MAKREVVNPLTEDGSTALAIKKKSGLRSRKSSLSETPADVKIAKSTLGTMEAMRLDQQRDAIEKRREQDKATAGEEAAAARREALLKFMAAKQDDDTAAYGTVAPAAYGSGSSGAGSSAGRLEQGMLRGAVPGELLSSKKKQKKILNQLNQLH